MVHAGKEAAAGGRNRGDHLQWFSGPRHIHALGCGSYCENEGWLIDGMDAEASDAMTVEAWCDLEPYMMGGARSTAEIARWGGCDDE